jgi:SAM-dependent methyltransferase
MGIIGGTVGYKLLRRIGKDGTVELSDSSSYSHRSKTEALLGKQIWNEITGKVVIDFGCGLGGTAIEMAQRGARKVIGLDIQERWLNIAREEARRLGVSDRCSFAKTTDERADIIIALDSFEHFDDPAEVLTQMSKLLKPSGCIRAAFGPTWYHPLGGHLFSVFPWAHLIFTEEALIRWRADFKTDGATRFGEVEGGLNQLTIRGFKRLVDDSPLRLDKFEAVPIRQLRPLANRFTRELTTAIVRCNLVQRPEKQKCS